MARQRPNFSDALTELIAHLASTEPAFAHIDPRRVLVVAGEARRASRSTITPLCFSGGKRTDSLGRIKPFVRIRGRRALYTITLRPLYFRRSSPRQRVATIVHELFHISLAFDGTLDRHRRHDAAGDSFARALRPVERRCWRGLPPLLARRFDYNGEVRVQQWLERPQTWFPGERAARRKVYSERHLFDAVVRMKSVRVPRGRLLQLKDAGP